MRSNRTVLFLVLAAIGSGIYLTSSRSEPGVSPSFTILAKYSQENYGLSTNGVHLLVAVDKFDVVRRVHGDLKCNRLLIQAFESSPSYPANLVKGQTYRLRFTPSADSAAELDGGRDFLWISESEIESASD